MAVKAQAKYVRMSPAQGARGRRPHPRQVGRRRAHARWSSPTAARRGIVAKVLNSAVANAENNNNLSADDLYVKEAFVDEGPTLKRWKFRAMGRVNRIRKRSSHITVAVERKEAVVVGQKVHPGGFRIGVIHDWKSHWYTEKEFKAVPRRRRDDPQAHLAASSPMPGCRASSSARTRTT